MLEQYQFVLLGELAELYMGATPSRVEPSYWADDQSGQPWVAIKDIQDKFITRTSETITSNGIRMARMRRVEPGTPIMSFKLSLGRAAIPTVPVYTNEAIVALKAKPGRSHARWLYHAVPFIAKNAVAETAIKGKTLNLEKLRKLCIPTPETLVEQCRIAEILDAVDEQVRATSSVLSKVHQLRDGVFARTFDKLASECSWKLVADEFQVAAGVTLGPHRIPSSNPHRYLRVANVQRGWIDMSDVAEIEASPAENPRWSLRLDDLLVVEGHANPFEIGRCARVPPEAVGLLYQNHLFRLRAIRTLPQFGELWLNSKFARSYWRRMCATSSGLYTVNSKMLGNMAFPDCDRDEQERVVRIVTDSSKGIEAQEAAVVKLCALKSALMDDLLTGRVRIPVWG